MPLYQVVTLQLWRSQDVRNVYYYESSDVLAAAQLTDIADHFRAAYVVWNTNAAFDDNWEFQGIESRRVDVAGLPGIVTLPTSGSLSGSEASSPGVANQVALLASLYAPTVAPRRARTYHAGIPDSYIQQDGRWSAAIVDEFGDFIEEVDTIVVTGDTLLRQAAQWDHNAGLVDEWNRLETYIVRDNPATQRRRRLGVGN